jgi:hypothetical protein
MANKTSEMLALPCTGKTTYLLRHKIPIIEADTYSNLKRIRGFVIETIRHPILAINIFKLFVDIESKYRYQHMIGVFRFFSRLYELRLKRNELGVFEEGFYQALWGVFLYTEISSNSVCVLDKMMSKSNILSLHIHYISCPKEELLLRNLSRDKKTRFSKLIKGKNELEIIRSRKWMALIIKRLRKNNSNIKLII